MKVTTKMRRRNSFEAKFKFLVLKNMKDMRKWFVCDKQAETLAF